VSGWGQAKIEAGACQMAGNTVWSYMAGDAL